MRGKQILFIRKNEGEDQVFETIFPIKYNFTYRYINILVVLYNFLLCEHRQRDMDVAETKNILYLTLKN